MARVFAVASLGLVVVGLLAYLIYLQVEGEDPYPADAFTATFVVLFSGLTATALIEMAKRLTKLRGRAHRRILFEWIRERLDVIAPPTAASAQRSPANSAGVEQASPEWDKLMHEVLPRNESLVFDKLMKVLRIGGELAPVDTLDLPSEQLAARLARSIDAVVRMPAANPELYAVFVGPDDYLRVAVVDRPLKDWPEGEDGFNGRDDGKASPLQHSLKSAEAWRWVHEPGSLASALESASTRAGLTVDDLQSRMSKRWVALLTWSSIMISVVTGALLSVLTIHSFSPALVLLSMTVGALVAWTARDIGAAIARLRTRV